MALGPPGKRDEPLHVFWMALALAVAAILGGAAGLLWYAAGFGAEEAALAEGEAAEGGG